MSVVAPAERTATNQDVGLVRTSRHAAHFGTVFRKRLRRSRFKSRFKTCRCPLYCSHDAGEIHLTIAIENNIRGAVIAPCETPGIGRGVLSQTGGVAENIAAKRMTSKDHRLELVIDQLGGRVVVTVDFIGNDVDLAVYLTLRINTMEYDVGQEVDRAGEVATQDCGIVDRLLFRSISVQVAADPLKTVGDVTGPATVCPLKSQVLAKWAIPLSGASS